MNKHATAESKPRELGAYSPSTTSPRESDHRAMGSALHTVRRYIRRHPGRSFGLSLVAGAVVSRLIGGSPDLSTRSSTPHRRREEQGTKPFFLSHMVLALLSAAAEEAIRRRMREGPSSPRASSEH